MFTDPSGLFVYKGLTAEQQKEFEEAIKKGVEALKQHKEGSKEYNAIKRALTPFWDFKKDASKGGVKDGITVTLKDPKVSQTGAYTDTYQNSSRIDIAFGSALLKDPVQLAGAIANEGYSVANKREGKKESLYDHEFNSLLVNVIVVETLKPNEQFKYNDVVLYDPSWAKADQATLDANRNAGVKQLIENPRPYGYGLKKPARKKKGE